MRVGVRARVGVGVRARVGVDARARARARAKVRVGTRARVRGRGRGRARARVRARVRVGHDVELAVMQQVDAESVGEHVTVEHAQPHVKPVPIAKRAPPWASWRSGGYLLAAPEHASGCPRLRPASAHRPIIRLGGSGRPYRAALAGHARLGLDIVSHHKRNSAGPNQRSTRAVCTAGIH